MLLVDAKNGVANGVADCVSGCVANGVAAGAEICAATGATEFESLNLPGETWLLLAMF